MNSYFDSEEEIAFGPITLEEIKFDLNRPRTKQIKRSHRRHTAVSKYTNEKFVHKENQSTEKIMSTERESSSKINNRVPDSSVYFTGADISSISQNTDNPYLSAENTLCFINAAMKMKNNYNLEEEIPEILVENTVLPDRITDESTALKYNHEESSSETVSNSNTYNRVPDSSVYFTAAETSKSSQNTDNPYLSAESTFHFVNAAMKMKHNLDLEEEVPETLVENTLFSLVNNVDNLEKSCSSNDSESSYCKITSSSYEDISESLDGVEEGVIIISSDDESMVEEVDENKQDLSLPNMKKENLSQNSYESRQDSSDSVSDVEVVEHVEENVHQRYSLGDIESGSSLNDDSQICKKILSVIPEETRCTSEFIESRKIQTSAPTSESSHDDSFNSENKLLVTENQLDDSSQSIIVPEINLDQFDESAQFNDTIELMDMMLKQAAINDQQEKNTEPTKESDKENQLEQCSLKTTDIISASFMQQPIDSLQIHMNSKETSPLGGQKSRIPTLRRKSQEEFKVPLTTPLRSKMKPALKNIASPVGLYIKYSPHAVLKKNVVQKDFSKTANPTSTKNPAKLSGNVEIPIVKYQPAKKQVCTSGSKLFCPSYMQKMMKDPVLTKHERKITKYQNSFDTEQNLQDETDLTRGSINDSCLNDTQCQDVSILKQTTALRR